ncbi:MAG: phosphoglycerate dehydrogenase [Chloroflexi bacterium]|nr:phosphoglycerate dehydrogenase [Chloroflexota bacterium]
MTFRILITDDLGSGDFSRLDTAEDMSYDIKTGLSQAQLGEIVGEYHGLITRRGTAVDTAILQAGKQLKVVGRAAADVSNIDVQAASQRGIIVMNTPQAHIVAITEHTMGMILAAVRHTAAAHSDMLTGGWNPTQHMGTQLYRKTLGLIGFGQIARLLARRACVFDMEVYAYDPYVSEEIGRELGVILVDLDDLLAQADVISLHMVDVADTHHLINAETIGQMKEGVIIVNGAQGALIDEAALAAALQNGKVQAAALDVFEREPPQNSPLIGRPNVLHTPHLGPQTIEAQRDIATQIIDQVIDALRGQDFRNAVNMPFQAGPGFETIRPHMSLAEKLGLLHCHLADGPIRRVEIEVVGEDVAELIKPVAAALLKGILQKSIAEPVNSVNAPILAEEKGITISQTKGISHIDYPNLISCQAQWDGGSRLLAGVLFGGTEPRLVQVDEYTLEARPEGTVLVLKNQDVPGVIGQVGTILAAYEVNIGEWRMGRDKPGGEALSFINLDSEPDAAVLDALQKIPAITHVKLITL